MKTETDTVKIGKFMLTWRDAVQRIHEKVNEAQMKIVKHVDETRTDKSVVERNQYDQSK